jgi:hypothetical protein
MLRSKLNKDDICVGGCCSLIPHHRKSKTSLVMKLHAENGGGEITIRFAGYVAFGR